MPDGTKVSNDPRFDLEEALQGSSNPEPNRGDVGDPRATSRRPRPPSAHRRPAGNNGPRRPQRPDPHAGNGSAGPEGRRQGGRRDWRHSPHAENPDSNEEGRGGPQGRRGRPAGIAKAQEKLDEDGAGDPNVDMDEWTSAQVMYELRRRNAAKADAGEPLIDLTGVSKKSQVVELLREDDAANPAPTEPPTPPAS
jgi:hypothetical protein